MWCCGPQRVPAASFASLSLRCSRQTAHIPAWCPRNVLSTAGLSVASELAFNLTDAMYARRARGTQDHREGRKGQATARARDGGRVGQRACSRWRMRKRSAPCRLTSCWPAKSVGPKILSMPIFSWTTARWLLGPLTSCSARRDGVALPNRLRLTSFICTLTTATACW